MRRTIHALLIASVAIIGSACDESLSSIAGPTPNLPPEFASIQLHVFADGDSSGRRACVACHNARQAAFVAGLILEGDDAYERLVNAPSRNKPGAILVVPGDAEASYLIHKVEGRPEIAGLRMPFNGPYLSDGQIAILKRWIDVNGHYRLFEIDLLTGSADHVGAFDENIVDIAIDLNQ
jgi:hypothetical protein